MDNRGDLRITAIAWWIRCGREKYPEGIPGASCAAAAERSRNASLLERTPPGSPGGTSGITGKPVVRAGARRWRGGTQRRESRSPGGLGAARPTRPPPPHTWRGPCCILLHPAARRHCGRGGTRAGGTQHGSCGRQGGCWRGNRCRSRARYSPSRRRQGHKSISKGPERCRRLHRTRPRRYSWECSSARVAGR